MNRLGQDPHRGWGVGFVLWFLFCALAAVAVLGVIIWAVIRLVTWVTSGGLS